MLLYVKRISDEEPAVMEHYVLTVDVGSDNLTQEDREEGYIGYLNWYADKFIGHAESDCGFEPWDAGMHLYKEENLEGLPGDASDIALISHLYPSMLYEIFDDFVLAMILDEAEEG